MSLQHVSVKVFVDGNFDFDIDEVAKHFHQWVSDQSLNDVLIDVADYQHVPEGPTLVLVGLETQYVIDEAHGKAGLHFSRKGKLEADENGQFADAVASALNVCERLEAAFDGLKFSRTSLEFAANDRAIFPSSNESQAKFKALLESFLQSIGQTGYTLDEERDARALVGVGVTLAQPIAASAGAS